MARLNEIYLQHKLDIDTNTWYIVNKQDFINKIKADVKESSASTLPNLLNPVIINQYIRDLILNVEDPSEDLIG